MIYFVLYQLHELYCQLDLLINYSFFTGMGKNTNSLCRRSTSTLL